MQPITNSAYKLLHEGCVALSQVEANGIRIDVDYLNRMIAETTAKVKNLSEQLKTDKIYKIWKKIYGQETNTGSREQLGDILFNHMGYESVALTDTGRHKTDKNALDTLDVPFVKNILEIERLKKANSTYLKGILKEVVDGYLHPVFNLHLVQTYRSCIAKGTLVEIVRDISKHPKGIPIENVKVGDFAYCYDEHKNLVIRKVLWAGKTGIKKVIRIHWSACGKKGCLDLTPEHKIRLVNGKYVRADSLIGDFRSMFTSKHAPKVQVLAMGRAGDRIWATGIREIIDHRFIYQQIKGNLPKNRVVHHKDGNHLNNIPSNLMKLKLETHSRKHNILNRPEIKHKSRISRIKNHKKYGNRWPKGEQCHNYILINKFSLLRLLAQNKGQAVKVPYDFGTVKTKAQQLGINLKKVKDRYDRNGQYISVGRLQSLSAQGRTIAKDTLGINFYKLKRLYEERNISTTRKWANQFGSFVVHNHKITKIEYINKWVDVYDIEVENCHNFIANEICVHNSADSPNFQNIPIRNPDTAKLIRPAFISRDNFQIVETDYSGIEVHGAAWYHKDPVMLKYLSNKEEDKYGNPLKDMHRDMARQCYILPKEELYWKKDKADAKRIKNIRYCGKNMFVFPEFYGDYYIDCAEALWNAISRMNLTTRDGVSLYAHLAEKGVSKLGLCNPDKEPRKGTFEHHIQSVEHDFWNNRFTVYNKWRKNWYYKYKDRGWFDNLTGFRFNGHFKRNEVINYPVQSVAFHCLLWSLIRLQKLLKKYNMKSLIIGQIHDSIVADVYKKELKNYLELCQQIMVDDLKKHWKWILTPIDIEAEVAPVGGNWYQKTKVEL